MRPRAVLVGLLIANARTHALPPKPQRPVACPACYSSDIHGARPCPRRRDLDDDVDRREHDWHCHVCRWSARINDAGW